MGLADCTFDTCDVSASPYGYRPSITANVVFLVVALLCFLRCVVAALWGRQAKCIPFAVFISVASVLEIVGYVDRLAGWRNPWDFFPFAQSTALLTVAPLFVTMSCLGELTRILGPEHAFLLPPTTYPFFFPPQGFAALILQVTGFAVAFSDSSAQQGLGLNERLGLWIVISGLALQLATLVVALVFLFVAYTRAFRAHARYGYTTFHADVGYVPLTFNFQVFLAVLPFACFCIFCRLIYKIAAFADGLQVGMAMDEGMFNGFEGLLLGYAMSSLVFCYPAIFLDDGKRLATNKERLVTESAKSP